jgi:putative ABC transport system permease protein
MNDFRFALRQLARTPGFTIVAVLTLALCIGANSAIFSVINAILLKPYPWPGSERLVYADNTYPLMGLPEAGVSVPDYLDRRAGVSGFEDSAMYSQASLNMSGDSQPEMIGGLRATPSLFTTLGSRAALGRVFTEADSRPDSPATIVLSYGLWKSRFGEDPSVIGRTIRVNGSPVTVIGVMGQEFYFPSPKIQAWTPFAITPAQREDTERGNEFSTMIARMKPGATVAGVQRELDQIQARLAERLPQGRYFWKTSGFDGHAVGFLEKNVRDVSSMLWLVQAGVAAALLIGCANVAGLLLARAVGREKELAIRTALGASRLRLARMLLSESVVLFVAGGLLGLFVAMWSLDALQAVGLSSLPRGFGVRLDPTVFAFTLGSALLTGLAFGALPSWSASRDNPSASLKESGARGSAGRRTQRLRAALVVSEVALAVMLVATASLLIKSFVRLQQVDPGFVPGGTIAARAVLPGGKYDKPEKIIAFQDAVIARLKATPGVAQAGDTDDLPFTGGSNSGSYSSPDIVLPDSAPLPHAFIRSADPGFLGALGLTLLKGRWFDGSDNATGRRVVVIDRTLVDRYWKGQDPIGKRIVRGDGAGAVTWTVVGVVATVKSRALDETSDKETIYFPTAQRPQLFQVFAVRTSGDPSMLAAPIRDAVHAVDPEQPVFDVMTMTQRMDDAAQPRRAPVVLLSVFGALAMILAMLGVYGVLAFSVAQRTSEFGVRMALGASPADIAVLVLRTGTLLVLAGVAIGMCGYLALNRLVATLLFDTPSMDPAMLMVAPLLLALVALAACLVPALRATRIEPVSALRHD